MHTMSAYSDLDDKLFNELTKSVKLVVITGGEPTLYKQEVLEIIKKSKEKGLVVNIETNGLLIKTLTDFGKYDNVEFSISPKFIVDNKLNTTVDGNLLDRYISLIDKYLALANSYIFKIVIGDNTEREETFIKALLLKGGKPTSIYLMPESRSGTEILLRTPNVFDLANTYQVNVSTRLQLLGLVL